MTLMPLHTLRYFRFDFICWAVLDPHALAWNQTLRRVTIMTMGVSLGLLIFGIGIGISIVIPSRMVTFTLDYGMSIRSMLGFLDFAWHKEQYKVDNESDMS